MGTMPIQDSSASCQDRGDSSPKQLLGAMSGSVGPTVAGF